MTILHLPTLSNSRKSRFPLKVPAEWRDKMYENVATSVHCPPVRGAPERIKANWVLRDSKREIAGLHAPGTRAAHFPSTINGEPTWSDGYSSASRESPWIMSGPPAETATPPRFVVVSEDKNTGRPAPANAGGSRTRRPVRMGTSDAISSTRNHRNLLNIRVAPQYHRAPPDVQGRYVGIVGVLFHPSATETHKPVSG
jgi:hypothetical protein